MKTVQEILHSVSIMGMDCVRHICLYLASRCITRDNVDRLQIPSCFAWEHVMEMIQNMDGGVQLAFDLFYHTEEKCLLDYLDTWFGTTGYSFDVKDPQKHAEILQILDTMTFEGTDMLEEMYRQCVGGNALLGNRQLGQYFTDRVYCRYMIGLCEPKLRNDGLPESIFDPCVGTGGFLTSYIQYIKKRGFPIHEQLICGSDIDAKCTSLTRLNLFFNTNGTRFQNIWTQDSTQHTNTYDLVVTNIPFGLKKMVYSSCSENIKKIKIRGTKSEPLFLQLCMSVLKKGGRCAIMVPEGLFVNTSILHNQTRRYLLDHFEVKRIIKIQESLSMILVFENSGRMTEQIEFWNICGHDIQETFEKCVLRNDIDPVACTLNYKTLKICRSISIYTQVVLRDVCHFQYGFAFSSQLFQSKGELAILRSQNIQDGEIIHLPKQTFMNRTTDTEKWELNKDDIVISMDFDCGRSGKILSKGFVLNQRMCRIWSKNENIMLNAYLYYYLRHGDFVEQMKEQQTGTTIKHISGKHIEYAKMILPPLSKQYEIILKLDELYIQKRKAWHIVKTTDQQAATELNTFFH